MTDNFNFDLDRIKQALDSPTVDIPPEIVTLEQFQEWLSIMDKNNNEDKE